jgi:zinc transport system substrate-binding protein
MKKLMLILAVGLFLGACAKVNEEVPQEKPQVVVSFFVLEALTEMIGNDVVEVTNLLPINADPHSYELSSTDMVLLGDVPNVIIMGNHFEHWYEEAYPQVKPENAKVLDVSVGIATLESMPGAVDPHIWSSITNLKLMSASIADYLIDLVPEQEDKIEENLKTVIDRLVSIEADIKPLFDAKQRTVFITQHPAFNYLANDLGLEMVSVSEPGHSHEVDAHRLEEIVEVIEKEGVTIVFYENPLEKDVAETLQLETGVDIQLLSALESVEAGVNILDLVEQNYRNLAQSLQ